MNYFAGIGSRDTPRSFDYVIASVCDHLLSRVESHGDEWTMNSGGADGADSMFESHWSGPKQIFLPWRGFNGNKSRLFQATTEARRIAARYHPAWDTLSKGTQSLHARNVHQVLGSDCATPVRFVCCWTPGSREVGGTAQAMRIARDHEIPIVNLETCGTLMWEMAIERIDEILGG